MEKHIAWGQEAQAEPVMHFMNTHSSHWVSLSKKEGKIPACTLISHDSTGQVEQADLS